MMDQLVRGDEIDEGMHGIRIRILKSLVGGPEVGELEDFRTRQDETSPDQHANQKRKCRFVDFQRMFKGYAQVADDKNDNHQVKHNVTILLLTKRYSMIYQPT